MLGFLHGIHGFCILCAPGKRWASSCPSPHSVADTWSMVWESQRVPSAGTSLPEPLGVEKYLGLLQTSLHCFLIRYRILDPDALKDGDATRWKMLCHWISRWKKNPYSTTTNTMSKTQFLFKKNCKVGDFTYFCKEYYLMRQQSSLVRSKIGDHITRLPINIHIFIQIRLYHVCVLMFLDVVCILLLTIHSLFQTFYAMKHRQQTQ